MKNKLLKRGGFTIVELLAVIAVTVLLGTILLANSRGPSRKFDVQRGAQTLVADLRKAQSLASSAQLGSCGPLTVIPNYGLRIQAASGTSTPYSLFADCNQNNILDTGAGAEDFIVESHVLANVFVSSTSPSSGGASFLDITYIPPIPDVAIGGFAFPYPALGNFGIRFCSSADTSLCVEVQGSSRGNVEVIE